MIRIICTLLFLSVIHGSYAQTLVPFLKKNGRYIYVDSATLKPVITREFGQAWLFNNGVARVNDKVRDPNSFFSNNTSPDYYIDGKGREVKAGVYRITEPFDANGFAGVTIDGKEGVYDRLGNEIVPAIYDAVYGYYEGPVFIIKQNSRFGMVNTKGQLTVAPKFEDRGFFNEGIVFMKLNDKWGAVDGNGKQVIPFMYDDGGRFVDGVADVIKDGKGMLIDKNNKPLRFGFEYEKVLGFGNGFAAVQRNGSWGYVNRKGVEVVPAIYDSVAYLVTGDRAAVALHGKWGLVDITGKLLAPCEYDEVNSFNDNSHTVVVKNGRHGMINKKGKLTVATIYDAVVPATASLAYVKLGDKWGVVDPTTGKLVLPVENKIRSQLDLFYSDSRGNMFVLDGVYRTAEGKTYQDK